MPKVENINIDILKKVYEKRDKNSHKNDYGRLLIIGGSDKYTGSTVFNALSAIQAIAGYRSGVDLVEVAAPKRVAEIVANYSPDIITHKLNTQYIKKKHVKKLLKYSKDKDAFVIGGGIGRNKKTMKAVRKFLKKTNLPGVIDADAIHALSNIHTIDLENYVFTPHSHEFSILSREKISQNLQLRLYKVKEVANRLDTTILLKGHQDIIVNNKREAINKTGNPYMTVGGTGDVLAGILGSLIAQNNNLFDSACAASFINGKAAENTGRKRSLIASDLLQEIGKIVDSV